MRRAPGSVARWWRDRGVFTKFVVMLAVPVLVVIGDCVVLLVVSGRESRADAATDRANDAQAASTLLLVELLNAETGVRGYLASGEPAFLQPYDSAVHNVGAQAARLRQLTVGSAVVSQAEQLAQLTDREMAMLAQLRGSADDPARITLLRQGKAVMDRAREQIDDITAAEQVAARRRQGEALINQRVARRAATLSIPLGLGTLLLAMAVASGLVRRIRAVERNAVLLGDGLPMTLSVTGRDEIGQLDAALRRAGALLEERNRRTVEAVQATAAARAANEMQAQFMSRVSHELRTPLNAVLGFGQLLQLDASNDRDRASVAQVLDGGHRLLSIVDQLLDIGQLGALLQDLQLQPVRIAELADFLADGSAALAARHGVRLDTAGLASSSLTVQADHRRLEVVLAELVCNAVKYNRPGGAVTVGSDRAGTGRVRLCVADTGTGIAEADRPRIFLPFDRLGAERGHVDGVGLGLAVAASSIAAMDGELGFDSTPGVGSTFWLELPVPAGTGDQPVTAD